MGSAAALKPVASKELQELLSSCQAFSDLGAGGFDLLAKEARRVFVPGGTKFLSSSDSTDAAYVVEHGRFVARIPGRAGETRFFEIARGEVVVLATTLAEEVCFGDLYALRGSTVIELSRSSLHACLAVYPEMIKGYSAWAIRQSRRLLGQIAPENRPQAFALFPASSSSKLETAADAIMQAFTETVGAGHMIDSQRVREELGCDPADEDSFASVRPELTAWLEEQEADGQFLLFVCDPTDSNWTRWCLRQTDRVMILAMNADVDEIERFDQMFAGRRLAGEEVRVDLLLIHDQDATQPRGAGRWLQLKCLRRHHQVRLGHAPDYQRACRRLSERAVGLVLGGGGARGLAHIGVLQALEEAHVPVDVIGGTSMGSVMAAAYARGWSPQQILTFVSDIFNDARAVRDIDFPMVSILAGRKLDKALRTFFADIDIADLWLPFFCISSSLSDGLMMVHDRGPVWEKVRASCSLPGIFPPVRAEDQILVDGGVMNNVPMDVMGERCMGGTVIAVNVGGGGAKGLANSQQWNTTGWNLLRHRLNPAAEKERIASIFDVLMWATTLSSKNYLQQLVSSGKVDLYLTPPVQEFQLLGFEAYEQLFEVGYEYTRKQLAGWDGLDAVVMH